MKILIVDDSSFTRKELNIFLNSGGYHDLFFAESALEALDYLRRYCGEGNCTMDIVMPEVDGIEACRRIKKMEGCGDIPIIMATAADSKERLGAAFDAGAIDYITKPINKIELLARVGSALRLKQEMDGRKAHEKELMELNQLKNKLLGMAAHDLRSPLNTIMLSSQFLSTNFLQEDEGRRKNLLKSIYSSADRMLALINDLLDVSVIESGGLKLRVKRGCLKKLVEDKISLMSIIAEGKGITIHQDIPDIAEIPFDSVRITQVIDNLLSNAIKFSPRGSNIYVKVAQDEDFVRVSVMDEGPGIPHEEQGRLFIEFQRLSPKPTGDEKSTGLGLAIVKKIVNAHGGDVWAESSPGSGTTFGFTLPMKAANNE